jgi:prolyl-tRNA synthetase
MATSPLGGPEFPPAGQPEEVETPDVETIDALAAFLHIDPRTTSKAMPVVAEDGQMVLALVRGDRRLHELKLRKALGQDFRPAQADEIEAAFGAKPGSIGPLSVDGHRVGRIVADATLRDGVFVAGANRTGWHVRNTVLGRDYQADVADIQLVEDGDPCPLCGGTLHVEPMIEVGNIFKLGTKYSAAMGATYLDEGGTEHPIVMGSYGIGPARVVAAAAEQGHDDAGLIWPPSIAPFVAWMVAIGDEAAGIGDRLSDELAEHGIAAMVDDRSQSPGAKFADADLIGSPLRVTIGKRTVSEGTVDVRVRKTGAAETLPLTEAAARVAELARELSS